MMTYTIDRPSFAEEAPTLKELIQVLENAGLRVNQSYNSITVLIEGYSRGMHVAYAYACYGGPQEDKVMCRKALAAITAAGVSTCYEDAGCFGVEIN